MRLPIRQHLVDAVEPLLVEFNVQLVVAAHVHKDERTTPVVNATVDPRGPVHITVGTGGNTYQVPLKPKPRGGGLSAGDDTWKFDR